MILEKLKNICVVLIFFLISLTLLTVAKGENTVDKIKKLEALIEFDRSSIKGLLIDLNKNNVSDKNKKRLNNLIEQKHSELFEKVEEYNKLLKATSYSDKSVDKSKIKKNQSIKEIEYEIGLDREITTLQKKVNNKYKDFKENKKSKDWRKKNKEHFEKQKRKKKIIFVE